MIIIILLIDFLIIKIKIKLLTGADNNDMTTSVTIDKEINYYLQPDLNKSRLTFGEIEQANNRQPMKIYYWRFDYNLIEIMTNWIY